MTSCESKYKVRGEGFGWAQGSGEDDRYTRNGELEREQSFEMSTELIGECIQMDDSMSMLAKISSLVMKAAY